MTATRKYSDDEVRAIIDLALDDETSTRDVSHEQLLAIASEVGLSSESIERAARDLQERRASEAARRTIVTRRRRLLAFHAAAFSLLNLALFAVNVSTTPGEWWFLFPVVFWGLALLVHAGMALLRGVSEPALARERKRRRAAQLPTHDKPAREPRVRLNVESEPTRVAGAEETLEPPEPAARRRQER